MLRIAGLLFGVAIVSSICEADDINVTAIYAMDADGRNVREVTSIQDYPIINSPEISPDGKWIAVDGWKTGESLIDARVLLVNIEDRSAVDLGQGAMPSWSSDGKWVSLCKYGADRGVYIRSVSGVERLIDREGWGIQWAPDGLKAAYVRGGKFVIHDFIGDEGREAIPAEVWPYIAVYWNCKWSNDSRQICFLGQREDGKREIGILDVSGDAPTLKIRCDATGFNPDIAWHPDGSRITLPKKSERNQPGQIYVFDPKGTEPPTRLEGQPSDRANSGMCWSPDGKTLFFLSRP